MAKTFDAANSEAFQKWLGTAFESAAERAMVAVAVRVVSKIQNEILPAEDPKPVDRGIYRAGWNSKKIDGGAEVFNNAPNAPIIEYGVRPENVKIGKAMIDALAAWAIRKGIVRGEGKDAARQAAWAIAQSMRKKGIFNRGGKNGLRILEKALPSVAEFVNEEFARELKREFEKP